MTTTGVRLAVRVTPRAGRDQIVGMQDGRLRVRVRVAPTDGQANEALIRLLARTLGIAPGRIELLRGAQARDKLLLIHGLSASTLAAQLARG